MSVIVHLYEVNKNKYNNFVTIKQFNCHIYTEGD